MSEKFNLKWNDFQTNVSKSFGLLRNESYLHDVTLVSDDFKLLSAHKLVLSSCSEYFRTIFQQTKQTQPLLCLDGVGSEDLKNVLDYVYEGEVKIHQEHLDRFLTIAQKFKLEGIVGDEEEEEEELHKDNQENNFISVNERLEQEKNNMISKSKKLEKSSKEVIAINSNREDVLAEVKKKINENIIKNEDRSLTCRLCGVTKSNKNRTAEMKRHIEVHIEGISYPCQLCNKSFRSSNCLIMHKSQYHRN